MNNMQQLNHICKKYEEKLIELMGKKEYEKFATTVAKDMFIEEMKQCPNKEFRDFTFDNLDIIFGENGGNEE